MNTNETWRALGWRHPLWDYIRFYSVIQRQRKDLREAWEEKLRNLRMEIDTEHELPIPEEHTILMGRGTRLKTVTSAVSDMLQLDSA